MKRSAQRRLLAASVGDFLLRVIQTASHEDWDIMAHMHFPHVAFYIGVLVILAGLHLTGVFTVNHFNQAMRDIMEMLNRLR
jgi:hypothetical protein